MFNRRRFPKLLRGTSGGAPTSLDGSGSSLSTSIIRDGSNGSAAPRLRKIYVRSVSSSTQSSGTGGGATSASLAASQRGSELANFDACVEACDALAASGGSGTTSRIMRGLSPTSSSSSMQSAGDDEEKNISETVMVADCSVMVSPDGALLFAPRDNATVNLPSSGPKNPSGKHEEATFQTPQKNQLRDEADHEANDVSTKTSSVASVSIMSSSPLVPPPPPPPPSTPNRNGPRKTNSFPSATTLAHAHVSDEEAEQLFPGQEYRSAVVMGADLEPGGDSAANGFSARGWSSEAATEAIRRAEASLRSMGTFVEDVVLCRKEGAARAMDACDRMRNSMAQASLTSSNSASSRPIMNLRNLAFRRDSTDNNQGNERRFSVRRKFLRKEARSESPGAVTSELESAESNSAATSASGPNDAKSAIRTRTESIDSASITNSDNETETIVVTPSKDEDFPLDAETAANMAEAKSRAGPLLFPGSSLHAATVALEKYHVIVAEAESNRWRIASSSIQTPSISSPGATSSSPSVTPQQGVLPIIRDAANKTMQRAERRERAILEAQRRAQEAEAMLVLRRTEAERRWEAVRDAEAEVQRLVAEKTRERSRERERRRMLELHEQQVALMGIDGTGGEGATGDGRQLETGVTQAELWELVSQVADEFDGSSFAPTGLPSAPSSKPIDQSLERKRNDSDDANASVSNANANGGATSQEGLSDSQAPVVGSNGGGADAAAGGSRPPSPPLPVADRSEIELECNLHAFRADAMAADEDLEDAAGALLNILSSIDTTRRSAKVATEACLLSAANAQAQCLRSLVQLERHSIEERLAAIHSLERAIDSIDVRSDLNRFIDHDKRERPGAATWFGDDDDGGIAAALAALNSHAEGVGAGLASAGTAGLSTFEGWGGRDNDDDTNGDVPEIAREDIEDAMEKLFDKESLDGAIDGKSSAKEKQTLDEYEKTVQFVVDVVGEKSVRARGHRAAACYTMNNQRSIETEIAGQARFDGLCRVFDALLTGCDRETGDIANAKMCMMLAQTFYVMSDSNVGVEASEANETPTTSRKKREFVKNRLMGHPIWSDEDFWFQALFQCVTESLTKSGVMANFDESLRGGTEATAAIKNGQTARRKKWYDLTTKERSEAASQVQAVVFAQLGALAHSMVEFGCSIEEACAFVRRLSIRHQLPISQRAMLLRHLIETERPNRKLTVKRLMPSIASEKEVKVELAAPSTSVSASSEISTTEEASTEINEASDHSKETIQSASASTSKQEGVKNDAENETTMQSAAVDKGKEAGTKTDASPENDEMTNQLSAAVTSESSMSEETNTKIDATSDDNETMIPLAEDSTTSSEEADTTVEDNQTTIAPSSTA